jgi:hypothetical protein
VDRISKGQGEQNEQNEQRSQCSGGEQNEQAFYKESRSVRTIVAHGERKKRKVWRGRSEGSTGFAVRHP